VWVGVKGGVSLGVGVGVNECMDELSGVNDVGRSEWRETMPRKSICLQAFVRMLDEKRPGSGRFHLYVGLARAPYIRCTNGIFGREITKYTVIYGACTQLWPTLLVCGNCVAYVVAVCGNCVAHVVAVCGNCVAYVVIVCGNCVTYVVAVCGNHMWDLCGVCGRRMWELCAVCGCNMWELCDVCGCLKWELCDVCGCRKWELCNICGRRM